MIKTEFRYSGSKFSLDDAGALLQLVEEMQMPLVILQSCGTTRPLSAILWSAWHIITKKLWLVGADLLRAEVTCLST